MKALLIAFSLSTLIGSAHANELLKSCSAVIRLDQSAVATEAKVIKRNNKIIMEVTQEGKTLSDAAMVSQHNIRAGLKTPTVDTLDQILSDPTLNRGEMLIIGALFMSTPDMKAAGQDTGLDLKKVRSVVAYEGLGSTENIGGFAIVEAKDKNGKDLGSFIGGYMIAPCSK